MTVVETVLVFVGIPAGVILVLFFMVYGKSLFNAPNRYRPGKPWDYAPSWYVPHPDAVAHAVPGKGDSTTATGGASGEW